MVTITTWLHFHEFYGRKIPNMSDLQLHRNHSVHFLTIRHGQLFVLVIQI